MKDLIEALTILLKYRMDPECDDYPTSCCDEDFIVYGVDFSRMTIEDLRRLIELDFMMGTDDEWEDDINLDECSPDVDYKNAIEYAVKNRIMAMHSFRFGSC